MPEVDESDYYYYDPTAANKIYVADGEEGQESYEVTNINAQGSNFKSKYGDHVKIKERQEQQAKATKKEAKPVEKLIRIVDAPKEKDDQKQKAAKKEDQKPKQPIVNKYKVDESKQKEQVKVNDMDQIMKQQQKEEQKLRDQQKRIGKQAKSKQEPENPDDIKSIFNAAAKANNGQSSKYVAPVDRDEIEVARKKKGFYQDEDQDPSQPNVKFNAYGMAIAGKGGAKDSVVKNEKESKIKSAGDNKKEQVKQKKIEDQIKNASKDVLPDESSDHEEQMKAEMNPAKLAKFEKKLKKKKKRKEMGSDYSSSDADDDFNVLPKSMQKKTSGPAVSAKKKGKKQESNLLSMFDEKSMKQKIKMALLDKE